MAIEVTTEIGKPGEKPSEAPPARPEHIPEKFWDAEKGEVRVDDLAKSYLELEKGGAKAPKAPAPKTPAANAPDPESGLTVPEAPPPGDPADEVEDFSKYAKEYDENEKLSDESYEELAKQGYKRELVDAFIKNQIDANAYRAQQYERSVFEVAGGEAEFRKLQEFIGANYSPEEKAEFNARMTSLDTEKATLAVEKAQLRMERELGHDPRRVISGSAPNTSGKYTHVDEYLGERSDPRYRTDPGYRRQVEEKLMRSGKIPGMNIITKTGQ